MGKDIFNNIPDEGTLTKIDLVCDYYAMYLKIINHLRGARTIKYIDLFSGAGVFIDGKESVPIRLLKMINELKINNIELYFNDIKYIKQLRYNIENNNCINNLLDICRFSNKDAREIDVKRLVNRDDIVLSFIDPSGHIGINVEIVSFLINNYLSDLVLFININSVMRHICVENEKDDYLSLFGSEENFIKFKTIMQNKSIANETKYEIFIKDFIDRLCKKMNKQVYCLPIYLKHSNEDTEVFGFLSFISKSRKGIDNIKEMGNNYNYLHIRDGKIIGFENKMNMINLNLLDDKSDKLLEYIPKDKYITRDKLIEKIDNQFIKEYGYVSAYGGKTVNHFLIELENNNIIDVIREKRAGKNTYGSKTKFKRK